MRSSMKNIVEIVIPREADRKIVINTDFKDLRNVMATVYSLAIALVFDFAANARVAPSKELEEQLTTIFEILGDGFKNQKNLNFRYAGYILAKGKEEAQNGQE